MLLSCLKYPHLKTQEMSDSVVGNTLFQRSGFWFSRGVTFVLKEGGVGTKAKHLIPKELLSF